MMTLILSLNITALTQSITFSSLKDVVVNDDINDFRGQLIDKGFSFIEEVDGKDGFLYHCYAYNYKIDTKTAAVWVWIKEKPVGWKENVVLII